MSANTPNTWREESEVWIDNYTDPKQHKRRKVQMLAKLQRLGIDKADRNVCVYDLCCGMGEALEVLYEMGFRNLHGVDITAYPSVAADERFDFVQSDVRALSIPDASVDWIVNIHSLHHLQTTENVRLFLDECYRVLKPGGCLGVIDFPASPQIKLAFRFFLVNWWLVTPYLRWFGRVVQSEWHFLPGYLAQWPQIRNLLFNGKFEVISHHQGLFYYYLTLSKSRTR